MAAAGFAAAFSTTTIDLQPGRETRLRFGTRPFSRVADRVNADPGTGQGNRVKELSDKGAEC